MIKLSRVLKPPIALCMMIALMASIGGCASKFTTIAPMPPQKYEKLGHVSGTSTGSLGILYPTYSFIPIGLNSRIDSAYNNALNKAPGATALIDVTFEESWFWWVIGTGRTVTISGEAIKEVTE